MQINSTKMKTKYIALFAFLFLFSCDENKVFHQFDKNFESNRWLEKDIKTYDFTISEENKYDVVIEFSHVYDYDMASIPLVIKMKTPDGNETTEKLDLPIKDETGKQLAECSGDICDLYYTYKANQSFTKGEYSISIANTSAFGFLPNVIGVGLTMNKSK